MAQRHLVERAERGLQPNQCRETLGLERMLDRFQPVGAFGVARWHRMREAGGMGEEQGRQEPLSAHWSRRKGHAWPVCHAWQPSERHKRNPIAP